MKATARPSPSAITQALVPYPPRDRPSASRVSRSADEPPFERHRLLSGGPGCWCRTETSSRAGHHALGPGAAAAPTRPGAPSGGRSAPPATRDQAQPGWPATWPRSDGARRWPTACAADPSAASCPWAGIPRSAAPASSSVRLSAWPLLPSQEEQNARNPIQFKREQALGFAATRVLGGLVFSLGLAIVMKGGAELFTGINLIVMAWASGKVSIKEILHNWVIVYLGNFVGAIGLVVLVFFSHHLDMNGGRIGLSMLNTA